MFKFDGIKRIFVRKPVLSQAELDQAQVMGIAMAGVKAAEMNARVQLNQGLAFEKLKEAMELLQDGRHVVANYSFAATQAKEAMESYEEGSVEHEVMRVMSAELFQFSAALLKQNEELHKDSWDQMEASEDSEEKESE